MVYVNQDLLSTVLSIGDTGMNKTLSLTKSHGRNKNINRLFQGKSSNEKWPECLWVH